MVKVPLRHNTGCTRLLYVRLGGLDVERLLVEVSNRRITRCLYGVVFAEMSYHALAHLAVYPLPFDQLVVAVGLAVLGGYRFFSYVRQRRLLSSVLCLT